MFVLSAQKALRAALIAVAIAGVAASPMARAQPVPNAQEPLTRAQVKADLVRVEQAGYRPGEDRVNYPEDIQAAEARVARQQSGANEHVYLPPPVPAQAR